MAEFPIMQVMTDAYLGDTRHLTTIEHGAYFLLLMAMWRSGGSLPSDDKFMARTSGLTLDRWRRMKPTIMAFMHPISGDRVTQGKLLEALSHVRRHRQSQSSRAKAMWLKKKGLPDAVASIRQSHGNANHNKIEYLLPVQSTTPPEKKDGSAEEGKAPPASATIEVSSALAGNRLTRKAS